MADIIMIGDDPRGNDYRERAAAIRRQAEECRFPDVRTRLLEAATGFDRLAAAAESRLAEWGYFAASLSGPKTL